MTTPETRHRSLIGIPGSRARIDTPALVLDLDAFEANIAAMAALARRTGVALRPHAKTHKSASIARALNGQGAIGHCCAKLGEAEALTGAGIGDLLVTSPIRTPAKIERLVALAARAPNLAVVAEDAANVAALAAAFAAVGRRLDVLVDVDVGTHRFGVTSPDAAVGLARQIAAAPSLRLCGVQGYAGHLQSIPDFKERRAANRAALEQLAAARDALLAAGLACPIVTGGGTGSHALDLEQKVLTELQVGSYMFSDVIYDGVDLHGTGARPFRDALFVYTRVISSQHKGYATTDAGSKSFAMDGPAPVIASGAPAGSRYDRFGDEFGKLVLPDPAMTVAPEALLACVVPHCDPNVNLFEHYVCVRGDRVEAVWPIEARGRAD
jgi:D-serine deaminase-like pyridoxal phosphate-dependent protein